MYTGSSCLAGCCCTLRADGRRVLGCSKATSNSYVLNAQLEVAGASDRHSSALLGP